MTEYSESFYKNQRDNSRNSADLIVPELIRLVSPRSVLDVGCGSGSWLSIFEKQGISDYLGLDGDWVTEQVLLIPKERFKTTDLTAPCYLGRRFDIAISMEVGEHIRTDCSDTFVETLVRHAPVVLFSAAIPMQGGTGHVNEQWQSWWAEKFARHGYQPIDCMRRKFWHDTQVRPWYAQNMVLYVDEKAIGNYPILSTHQNTGPMDVVHPATFLVMSDMKRKSVGALAKNLPGAIKRAVTRRILPG